MTQNLQRGKLFKCITLAYSSLTLPPAASNLIDLTVDESQSWQLQPQFTSLSPQMAMASYTVPLNYDPSTVQAQFTAFDPYAQQAQYEALLQAEWARQQAEAAEQQQQYYALQLQAAQIQATQLQASQLPLTSQKTTFGCVFPLNSFLLAPSLTSPPAGRTTLLRRTTSLRSQLPRRL
jgi:hypothetical protein